MFTHSKVGFEFADSPPTTTSFFVCSTPRCGSSLICEALVNSGLAGAPTEFFDAQLQNRFLERWDIDTLEEYLAKLLERKTGPNGVFGAKVHYNQYKSTFGINHLPTFFPNLNFIWIRRKNVLEQAVSYARAIQTNLWSSEQPGNGDQPIYQFNQIASLLARIKNEQSYWAGFFRQHGIEPLELFYEELAEDLFGATSECLDFLEIHPPPVLSIEPLTLRKQADQISVDWIERFESERR